jgi:hypothetical protein
MGLDVLVPERPVHESLIIELFSVTVHDAVLLDVHETVVVSPARTSEGFTVKVADAETEYDSYD